MYKYFTITKLVKQSCLGVQRNGQNLNATVDHLVGRITCIRNFCAGLLRPVISSWLLCFLFPGSFTFSLSDYDKDQHGHGQGRDWKWIFQKWHEDNGATRLIFNYEYVPASEKEMKRRLCLWIRAERKELYENTSDNGTNNAKRNMLCALRRN